MDSFTALLLRMASSASSWSELDMEPDTSTPACTNIAAADVPMATNDMEPSEVLSSMKNLYLQTQSSEEDEEETGQEKDKEIQDQEKDKEIQDQEKDKEIQDQEKDKEIQDQEKDKEIQDQEKAEAKGKMKVEEKAVEEAKASFETKVAHPQLLNKGKRKARAKRAFPAQGAFEAMMADLLAPSSRKRTQRYWHIEPPGALSGFDSRSADAEGNSEEEQEDEAEDHAREEDEHAS